MRHITPLKRGGIYTREVPLSFASVFNEVFIEAMTINHISLDKQIVFISESITVDDIPLEQLVSVIIELITTSDVVTSQASIHPLVSEVVNLQDLISSAFALILLDNLTVDDPITEFISRANVIAELLTLSGIAPTKITAFNAIAVSLAMTDFLTDINENLLENITVSELLLEVANLINILIEDHTVADTAIDVVKFFSITDEDISTSDLTSFIQSLHSSILEDIVMGTLFSFNNIVYEGWVINPETFSVWNYDNFNFNSSTIRGKETLFANSTGLYQLGGDFDEDKFIESRITTSSLDFGTTSQKQVPELLLGTTNTGKLILKVSVDGSTSTFHRLVPNTVGLDTQQIKIGKGLIGRYWQFTLITENNTGLDIDSIEFLPIVFKRKHR